MKDAMITNRSEIFDNFAAQALKEGLISEAKDDPRRGSDDISTIEALYGVKPNGSQDDKSIVEQAHPDMCIIAPAYDHLNSIIENVIERQNIMVGIINKGPQAKLTQHRYASAHEDLKNEVLKLGFMMDNRNEDGLRVLADSCAVKITKEALGPLPIIALIAAGLGLMAAYNHFGSIDQGVRANCEGAVRQLNDVIEDEDYASIHGVVSKMIRNISFVKGLADKIAAKSSGMPKASINQAVALTDSPEYKAMEKLLDMYSNACGMLAEKIPAYIELLKSVGVGANKEYESGWLATLKSVVQTVWTTDITDAVNYLTTLQGSLSKSSQEIQNIRLQYAKYVEVNSDSIIAALDVEGKPEKAPEAKKKEDDDDIESQVTSKKKPEMI